MKLELSEALIGRKIRLTGAAWGDRYRPRMGDEHVITSIRDDINAVEFHAEGYEWYTFLEPKSNPLTDWSAVLIPEEGEHPNVGMDPYDVADKVLDYNEIFSASLRNGAQIRDLLADAVRISRRDQS